MVWERRDIPGFVLARHAPAHSQCPGRVAGGRGAYLKCSMEQAKRLAFFYTMTDSQ